MESCYSIFGLRLVCSQPLPHGSACAECDGDVVHVALDSTPALPCPTTASGWDEVFESIGRTEGGEPGLRIWHQARGHLYRFRYADGTEFYIDRPGARIWARWCEPNTIEDIESYLLGPILGFVLRLRGVITVHASAVDIDGRAIALAGHSGCGKSTTAAAFALRGYPVLSDDVTALRPLVGRFLVQTDNPLLCLWPQSLELLDGPEELPRLSGTWDKRYLDLETLGRRSAVHARPRVPRPLAAIYLLSGGAVCSATPVATRLCGHEAFMKLVGNTYAHLLDSEMQAREFDVLSQVLSRVPFLSIARPSAGVSPRELCEFIASDFRQRSGNGARALEL